MGKGMRTSEAYYNQIWARDSFISFLGANLAEDEKLIACAKRTVDTFAKTVSPLGQVANFYDLSTESPEYGYSGSTDSSSWYIIGLASLFAASDDRSLLGSPLERAIGAYKWLRHQDANNVWLIDSPPGGDWMDAAVRRSGKTLYCNALFLMATRCLEFLLSASGKSLERPYGLDLHELKQRLINVFLPGVDSSARIQKYWPRLASAYDGGLPATAQKYFLHYLSFSRTDIRFDTLSNLLCILSSLADSKTAISIIATMNSRRLSKPYPCRVLDPPYRTGGAGFDQEFDDSLPAHHRSAPYAYHNGAVWPFVGGLHVAALRFLGVDGAEKELEQLAAANSLQRKGEDVGFNEWIHGMTGEPMGQFGQSWSAGMFVGAVLATRGKQPFSFLRV